MSSSTKKKIFVALRMAGVAGRDKLAGIFRYLTRDAASAPSHRGRPPDWDLTIIRTANEFSPERMRAALAAHYDGFIVSIPDTERTAALLADSSVPTIVMDIHDPALSARTENIVFIRNSPDAIGRAAADFLLSTGHCRSYAFVHRPDVIVWSRDRCRAFREMLRDRGFWCHELEDASGLHGLPRPIGVLVANDDTGYDTLEWCRAHRLRVPEDALVIGINNDTLICENCRPRLTSIQPDFEAEGYMAAEALDRMMANPQPSTPDAQPLTLFADVKTIVRRDSTTEVAPAGKLVQKALAYIRAHALEGISVTDVVRHLGCSRRLADLRFRALQGTTIGETIITLRLDEVRLRLATTSEPIDSIARACGYANVNYLKNLFKRRIGMPMRDYRAKNTLN